MKLLDDDPSDLKAILKNDQLEQFSPLVAIAATTVVVTLEILKLAGRPTARRRRSSSTAASRSFKS
jgi:hypothetical protein